MGAVAPEPGGNGYAAGPSYRGTAEATGVAAVTNGGGVPGRVEAAGAGGAGCPSAWGSVYPHF
jgi:hypothetical protein